MDPNSAHVEAIEAIRDFRAALATFASRADDALYEAQVQIRQVIDWLLQDRPAHWKNEVRKAYDQVARARADLERCQAKAIGTDRPSCIEERKAYEKARSWLRHCEQQIENVKHWTRVVQHEASEFEGRVTPLGTMLQSDLPRALAVLERMFVALDDYTSLVAPADRSEAAAGSGGEPGGGAGGSGSFARSSAGGRPQPAWGWEDLYARLRFRAPTAAMRAQLPPPPAGPAAPADWPPEALALAGELGLAADLPGWSDRIVAGTGWDGAEEVYLLRCPQVAAGDSGWFIAAVERPEAEEFCTRTVADLAAARPELLAACGLPPGYLAHFASGRLQAVQSDRREQAWPPARAAQASPSPRPGP